MPTRRDRQFARLVCLCFALVISHQTYAQVAGFEPYRIESLITEDIQNIKGANYEAFELIREKLEAERAAKINALSQDANTIRYLEKNFNINGNYGELKSGQIVSDWTSLAQSNGLKYKNDSIKGSELAGAYSVWRERKLAKAQLIKSQGAHGIETLFMQELANTSTNTPEKLNENYAITSDGTKIQTAYQWEQWAKDKGLPGAGASLMALWGIYVRRKQFEAKQKQGQTNTGYDNYNGKLKSYWDKYVGNTIEGNEVKNFQTQFLNKVRAEQTTVFNKEVAQKISVPTKPTESVASKKYTEVTNLLNAAKTEIPKLENQKKTITAQINSLRSRQSQSQSNLNRAKSSWSTAQNQVHQKQAQLRTLEASFETLEQKYTAAEKAVNSWENDRGQTQHTFSQKHNAAYQQLNNLYSATYYQEQQLKSQTYQLQNYQNQINHLTSVINRETKTRDYYKNQEAAAYKKYQASRVRVPQRRTYRYYNHFWKRWFSHSYTTYTYREDFNAKRQFERAKQAREMYEQRINRFNESKNFYKKKLAEAKKTIGPKVAQLKQLTAFKTQITNLRSTQSQLSSITRAITSQETNIVNYQKQIERYRNAIKQNPRYAAGYNRAISNYQNYIRSAETRILSYKTQRNEKVDLFEKSRAALQKLNLKGVTSLVQHPYYKQRFGDLTKLAQTLPNLLDQITQTKQAGDTLIQKASAYKTSFLTRSNFQAEFEAKKKQKVQLQHQITQSQRNMNSYQSQINSYQAQVNSYQNQTKTWQNKLQQTQQKITEYKTTLSEYQTSSDVGTRAKDSTYTAKFNQYKNLIRSKILNNHNRAVFEHYSNLHKRYPVGSYYYNYYKRVYARYAQYRDSAQRNIDSFNVQIKSLLPILKQYQSFNTEATKNLTAEKKRYGRYWDFSSMEKEIKLAIPDTTPPKPNAQYEALKKAHLAHQAQQKVYLGKLSQYNAQKQQLWNTKYQAKVNEAQTQINKYAEEKIQEAHKAKLDSIYRQQKFTSETHFQTAVKKFYKAENAQKVKEAIQKANLRYPSAPVLSQNANLTQSILRHGVSANLKISSLGHDLNRAASTINSRYSRMTTAQKVSSIKSKLSSLKYYYLAYAEGASRNSYPRYSWQTPFTGKAMFQNFLNQVKSHIDQNTYNQLMAEAEDIHKNYRQRFAQAKSEVQNFANRQAQYKADVNRYQQQKVQITQTVERNSVHNTSTINKYWEAQKMHEKQAAEKALWTQKTSQLGSEVNSFLKKEAQKRQLEFTKNISQLLTNFNTTEIKNIIAGKFTHPRNARLETPIAMKVAEVNTQIARLKTAAEQEYNRQKYNVQRYNSTLSSRLRSEAEKIHPYRRHFPYMIYSWQRQYVDQLRTAYVNENLYKRRLATPDKNKILNFYLVDKKAQLQAELLQYRKDKLEYDTKRLFAQAATNGLTQAKANPALTQTIQFLRKMSEVSKESQFFSGLSSSITDQTKYTSEIKKLEAQMGAGKSPYESEIQSIRKAMTGSNQKTFQEWIQNNPSAWQAYLRGDYNYSSWKISWTNEKRNLGRSGSSAGQKFAKHLHSINANHTGHSDAYEKTLINLGTKAANAKLSAYNGWQRLYHEHPLVHEAKQKVRQERLLQLQKAETARQNKIKEQIAFLKAKQASAVNTLSQAKDWLFQSPSARASNTFTDTILQAEKAAKSGLNLTDVHQLTNALANERDQFVNVIQKEVLADFTKPWEVNYQTVKDDIMNLYLGAAGKAVDNMKFYSSAAGKAYTNKLYDGRAKSYGISKHNTEHYAGGSYAASQGRAPSKTVFYNVVNPSRINPNNNVSGTLKTFSVGSKNPITGEILEKETSFLAKEAATPTVPPDMNYIARSYGRNSEEYAAASEQLLAWNQLKSGVAKIVENEVVRDYPKDNEVASTQADELPEVDKSDVVNLGIDKSDDEALEKEAIRQAIIETAAVGKWMRSIDDPNMADHVAHILKHETIGGNLGKALGDEEAGAFGASEAEKLGKGQLARLQKKASELTNEEKEALIRKVIDQVVHVAENRNKRGESLDIDVVAKTAGIALRYNLLLDSEAEFISKTTTKTTLKLKDLTNEQLKTIPGYDEESFQQWKEDNFYGPYSDRYLRLRYIEDVVWKKDPLKFPDTELVNPPTPILNSLYRGMGTTVYIAGNTTKFGAGIIYGVGKEILELASMVLPSTWKEIYDLMGDFGNQFKGLLDKGVNVTEVFGALLYAGAEIPEHIRESWDEASWFERGVLLSSIASPGKKNEIAAQLQKFTDYLSGLADKINGGELVVTNGIIMKADGSSYNSGNNQNTEGVVRVTDKVANISEFFDKYEFGKDLKKASIETNRFEQGQRIYKITDKTINSKYGNNLKKGDYFYLDPGNEGDHLEIYDKLGNSKLVLDFRGNKLEAKTKAAEARTINIK